MTVTLEEAKDNLRAVINKGGTCPCCNQFAKVYRRKLNSGMALTLIIMYRKAREFQHIEDILAGEDVPASFGGDFAKLRFWGLAEFSNEAYNGSSNKSGLWKITPEGIDFCTLDLSVQKYAKIYNNVLMKLDGEYVDVIECLGNKFNYHELMKGI